MSVELTIETVEETIVLELQDHVPVVLAIDNIPELRDELDSKVDKELGYSLIPGAEITRIATMETGATKNRADSANADKIHEHVIADVTDLDDALAGKVDKVEGYSLVADDEIGKLSTVDEYAQKNTVSSVAGKQGDVLLEKSDVGLGAVDNTADADKPVSTAVAAALADKVDKEVGMGLSELSFTTVDKLSLDQSEQDRHTHNNKTVIDGLSDDAGVLQYKGLPISDQAALDAKVDKVAGYSLVDDAEIAKLATVHENATKNRTDSENADKVHTHTISDVIGLTTRLNDIEALTAVSSVTWDMTTDTYTGSPKVTLVHKNMRRCVINNQAQVQYYLDEFDSTKKEDGTPDDLSGADGQVVVEINPTYVRRSFVGSKMTTELTHAPLPGFKLHEAFSGGVLKHYIGAYQATVWSVAGGENLSGLNLDNNLPRIDLATDYLTSLPDSFAMVGVSRTNFRTLAQNGGYQLYDYWQWELLKTLFIAEFGNWNSQVVLGNGNVFGNYNAPSSDVQSDSPHTMNGRSNSLGNNSGSSATNPFVSYRGIENPWGNAYQWVDGVNILEHQLWVSNDETLYNDTAETGYVALGAPLPTGGWIKEWQKIANGFLPAVVGSGAGTATFIGDYLYTSTGRKALRWGGAANYGARAGLCCAYGDLDASRSTRSISARLSKKLRA